MNIYCMHIFIAGVPSATILQLFGGLFFDFCQESGNGFLKSSDSQREIPYRIWIHFTITSRFVQICLELPLVLRAFTVEDLGFPVGGAKLVGGENSLRTYVSKNVYVKPRELAPLGGVPIASPFGSVSYSVVVFF